MKLKKLLVVLLCIVMATVSFAACGNDQVETPPEGDAGTEDVTEPESNVVEEAAMAYFASFPEDRHVITAADLFAKMDAGEAMFILDIRSADDYATSHLTGAVNMPFGNQSIAQNLEVIPDDVPVYVCCYTGQTASQTAAVLSIAGKYAYNVQSGFTNGVSKEANYESYVTADPTPMPTDTYAVDSELKAAVTDYYATLASYVGTATENQNIKVDAVKEIVDAEADDYFILSVRRADDFAEAHIKGATNIPFGAGMQASFGEIPKDKKIVVYCYSGQTASQVVGVLRMLGYEAFNMAGGMGSAEAGSGWLGAGNETVAE